MQKTILVTGGAGYIGSHVALLLVQKGYRVVVLDLLLHGQTFDHNWATFIKGDCGDAQLLKKLFKNYPIHAVVHCAALIEVGKSVKNPLSFYHNNVGNTIILLKTMCEYGINKFIFSSSCAVYGPPESIPMPDNHVKKPISPYGNTKLMIETVLHDVYAAEKLQFVALRYFNASGAMPQHGLGEQHKPETHIIPLLLRAALLQKPFSIFGTNYPTPDGTCVRDFVHVWDLAYAHLRAVEHINADRPSDYFNLGTGRGVSVRQMIDTVCAVTGKKIPVSSKPKRAGDPPILVADASRAHDILSWQPHYSDLENIIQSAYAYEIQGKNVHNQVQV